MDLPQPVAAVQTAVRTLEGLLLADTGYHPALATFPRDIESLILYGLQLPVVRLPDLTPQAADSYLCRLCGIGLPATPGENSRDLYGLLHVGPPCNAIFLRAGLAVHIERYVLAHELGHFLADVFLVARLWAASLPQCQEAIRRAFDWQEFDPLLELQAAVKGLPRRPHAILARGSALEADTAQREIQADLIARELLAPWEAVAPLFAPDQRLAFARRLQREFALPLQIGTAYFDELKHHYAPLPDLIDRLFAPFLDTSSDRPE